MPALQCSSFASSPSSSHTYYTTGTVVYVHKQSCRCYLLFASSPHNFLITVPLQFYSHIKKKLAYITEYLLPHRHDNSHLRRRHKLDQLPSGLSSGKSLNLHSPLILISGV